MTGRYPFQDETDEVLEQRFRALKYARLDMPYPLMSITGEMLERLGEIERQRNGIIEREVRRLLERGVAFETLSTRSYSQEPGRLDLVQGDAVVFSTWLAPTELERLREPGAVFIRYQRITWRARAARRLADALAVVSKLVGQ